MSRSTGWPKGSPYFPRSIQASPLTPWVNMPSRRHGPLHSTHASTECGRSSSSRDRNGQQHHRRASMSKCVTGFCSACQIVTALHEWPPRGSPSNTTPVGLACAKRGKQVVHVSRWKYVKILWLSRSKGIQSLRPACWRATLGSLTEQPSYAFKGYFRPRCHNAPCPSLWTLTRKANSIAR